MRSSILGIPWAVAKALTDLSPKTDVFYIPTPLQLFNFSTAPVFPAFCRFAVMLPRLLARVGIHKSALINKSESVAEKLNNWFNEVLL